MDMRDGFKNIRIGQSAAKPRIEERSTISRDEYSGVGLQVIGNSKC